MFPPPKKKGWDDRSLNNLKFLILQNSNIVVTLYLSIVFYSFLKKKKFSARFCLLFCNLNFLREWLLKSRNCWPVKINFAFNRDRLKKTKKKPSFTEILLIFVLFIFVCISLCSLCISFPHLISRWRLLAFWLWRRISNTTYEKPGETRKDKQNFHFSPSWRSCMYEHNSKIFLVSIFLFFLFHHYF